MPVMISAYGQISKDEKFHLGLGRLLLERYTECETELEEVLRSMKGMAYLRQTSND
jgi:hypothetical protein